MADVPDHLIPSDGLTRSFIYLEGLDVLQNGGALVRFKLTDENGDYFASYGVTVRASKEGTTDQLLARAHQKMIDVLRQWTFVLDVHRQIYEKRGQ